MLLFRSNVISILGRPTHYVEFISYSIMRSLSNTSIILCLIFLIFRTLIVAFPTSTSLSPIHHAHSSHFRFHNNTATSNSNETISKAPSASQASTATLYGVPGAVTEACNADGPPCTVFCDKNNARCIEAAKSITATCLTQWLSYFSYQNSLNRQWATASSGGAWSEVTSTSTWSSFFSTTTAITSQYTSFSTTHTIYAGDMRTITPVYALGSPIRSTTTITYGLSYTTYFTAPAPICRYTEYDTYSLFHLSSSTLGSYTPGPSVLPQTTACGQCTLDGGTVQLYWWPTMSSAARKSNLTVVEPDSASKISVLDGTTFVSPSVYVSLHSIYATNSCSRVGKDLSATLLAVQPQDLSTLQHWGEMVAQSGANVYGRLNFTELTGLPPELQYELQPSCVFAGCATIYPTPVSPILVVPSQVRSMDPAWADCVAGLNGLCVNASLRRQTGADIS